MTPSKAAFPETTLLVAFAGTAGAQIIAPKLFLQHLVAVDDSHSTLHLRFGWESTATFAHCLKKMAARRNVRNWYVAWRTFPSGFGFKQDTDTLGRFTFVSTPIPSIEIPEFG